MSGNLIINVVDTKWANWMSQTINVTTAYYQEQAHSAPQVPLTFSGSYACSSCGDTSQIIYKSTDPSLIITFPHNAAYNIRVAGTVVRTRPAPPPLMIETSTTPFDVTSSITADGLVFTSSPDDIIAWDPDTMSSVNISSAYDDAQEGTCTLTYDLYSTAGNLVYTRQFTGLDRPGDHTWAWTGIDSQSNPVGKGLYVVKSTVTANIPTMTSDCSRSGYLSIQDPDGPKMEYVGFDDNGTPETTDDNYLYYIKCYKLVDTGNLDACEGELWMYNPDLQKIKTWDISSLYCRAHESNDGLEASSSGIEHDLLIRIPASLMTSDGVFRFVAHVRDSHANDYRNHTNKWAIDRNSTATVTPKVIVEVDGDVDFLPTTSNSTQVNVKIKYEGTDAITSKMPITVTVEPSHMRSTCSNYAQQASEVYTYSGSEKPKADFVWQSVDSTSIQPDRTLYNNSISKVIYSSIDPDRIQNEPTYTGGQFNMTFASYDYGGRMKVTVAAPANRSDVKVVYLDDPSASKTMTYMYIPWDYDEDRIADKWEINEATNLTSLSFNTDIDGTPNTPDSNTGDGYYAFEEYRGFIANGSHLRTDPHHKDLFMRSSLGYGNIASATGFDFHTVIDNSENEMTNNQLMTQNCYVSPSNEWSGEIHSQKGIRVIIDNDIESLGQAPYGTPNNGGLIKVNTDDISSWADGDPSRSYDAMIAHVITHEAGHCIYLTPPDVRDFENTPHHYPTINCVMYKYAIDDSVNINTFCDDCENHIQLH